MLAFRQTSPSRSAFPWGLAWGFHMRSNSRAATIQDGFTVDYVTPLGWGDFHRVADRLAREHPADLTTGSWEIQPSLDHQLYRFVWRQGHECG